MDKKCNNIINQKQFFQNFREHIERFSQSIIAIPRQAQLENQFFFVFIEIKLEKSLNTAHRKTNQKNVGKKMAIARNPSFCPFLQINC